MILQRITLMSGALFLLVILGLVWYFSKKNLVLHSTEPTVSVKTETLNEFTDELFVHPRLRGLDDWKRPEGPWKVGLQVGHWKATEAPDELENLRVNTGTSYGSITEWETALAIAEKTKAILEASGIQVELLPTTLPQNYWADVFVSIHADGNQNTSISGYKVAAPRRDHTGKAESLARLIEESYGATTKLRLDSNITRTMRGYYAFNWRRYDHSIHPLTVAAIVETGFLTNPSDRRIITTAPEKPAAGIAEGIIKFLGITAETDTQNDDL